MTTASLHREMVEALRAIARNDEDFDLDCAHLVTARAALEGWEKRPRLRDQPEVVRLLRDFGAGDLSKQETADALEAALYGERG